MRLSSRARYAVMAMVELARRARGASGGDRPAGDRPVSLAEIAAAQQLSPAYLEQLFGRLRRGGLLASARGPGGGYRLARADHEITVASIVDAVDEPITATRCTEGVGCLGDRPCLTHALWDELGTQIHLFLGGITLSDILDEAVTGRARAPQAAVAGGDQRDDRPPSATQRRPLSGGGPA